VRACRSVVDSPQSTWRVGAPIWACVLVPTMLAKEWSLRCVHARAEGRLKTLAFLSRVLLLAWVAVCW